MYYSKIVPYGLEGFKSIVNRITEQSIKHKPIHPMQRAAALSLQKNVNSR